MTDRDDVFDPNEYVVALYLSCKSWKHVYWRIWGLQTKFECKECQRIYPASEFLQCRKHIFNPIYNSEGLKGCGIYPCCKRPVLKFMPFGGNQGCHYAPHIPIRTSGKTYDIFLKISKFISWRSPSDDKEPIKITATEILIPEKKLFKKWDFVTKTSVIQNQTKSDSKNTAKVSSTQLQFDQRRKGNGIFVNFRRAKTERMEKLHITKTAVYSNIKQSSIIHKSVHPFERKIPVTILQIVNQRHLASPLTDHHFLQRTTFFHHYQSLNL